MQADLPVSALSTITVTFNPDLDVLRSQFDQLPDRAFKVLIDNASSPELLAGVRALAVGRNDVLLVENASNVGLAQALNQGAAHAQSASVQCAYLLFLDQDTEPGAGGVEALFAGYQRLSATHPRIGCVGPRLVDVKTGLAHGFHQMSGGRWVRRFPTDDTPMPVANLNGSGTLVSVDVFNRVGGFDGGFFIDHVDTDWAFRVLAAGFDLYGIPGVSFRHRMGTTTIRFWFFGWRLWPYRSPTRHFYLFRNTARLLRRPYVPWVWKLWAPVKLAMTFFLHLGFDRQRWSQCAQMIRGLRAGFRDD